MFFSGQFTSDRSHDVIGRRRVHVQRSETGTLEKDKSNPKLIKDPKLGSGAKNLHSPGSKVSDYSRMERSVWHFGAYFSHHEDRLNSRISVDCLI